MPAFTTIIQQPVAEPISAYRPIEYRISVAGAVSQYEAAVHVAVFCNGVQQGPPIPLTPYSFNSTAATSINLFSVNIAKRVQGYFVPEDFWPPLRTPAAYIGAGLQADVHIEVTTFYPDTNGLLREEATVVGTGPIPVLNATRRPRETENMNIYDAALTPTLPKQAAFMTRKPTPSTVCLDESEYVGAQIRGINSMRVQAFDYAGALQAEGQIAIGSGAAKLFEVAQLAVGPANINNISLGTWLAGTTQVTIDDTTQYYIIDMGQYIPGGGFTSLSPIRTYYLVPTICRTARIHFHNSFSCTDSFSVWNNEKVELTVKADGYAKPLEAGYGVQARELGRVQAKGRMQVVVNVVQIPDNVREWLAEEFSMVSSEVRMEIGGVYVPMVLKAGKFTVTDRADDLGAITFTLEYSQQHIGLRS